MTVACFRPSTASEVEAQGRGLAGFEDHRLAEHVVGEDQGAVADEGVAAFQAVDESGRRQRSVDMDVDPRVA